MKLTLLLLGLTAEMSTFRVSILGSRTLLSAALTKISSKILYNPGAYVMSCCTSCSPSWTHSLSSFLSVLPMYVSGRSKMCSSCDFFWYTSSMALPCCTLVLAEGCRAVLPLFACLLAGTCSTRLVSWHRPARCYRSCRHTRAIQNGRF